MKVISICLTDLPAEKFTKSEKNGKMYLSLVVDDRKEKDAYGNDVTVYVNQTKEERLDKVAKIYVGQGKTYDFTKAIDPEILPASKEHTDLPF